MDAQSRRRGYPPLWPDDTQLRRRHHWHGLVQTLRIDQKEKSSAVSEHDSLKNSGTVSEYEVLEGGLRAAREDSCVIQGKGILQTPQPIKEALLEFGLTLPLVSAFTSDAYFQGPQTQRNKKKIKF